MNKRYARFPYWKEIGLYCVLICSPATYDAIVGDLKSLVHRTGLHTCIVLGVVLVDESRYQCEGSSTWGLFYSGKHFGAIFEAARRWATQRELHESPA